MIDRVESTPRQYLPTLEVVAEPQKDSTKHLSAFALSYPRVSYNGKVQGFNIPFAGVQPGMLLGLNAAGELTPFTDPAVLTSPFTYVFLGDDPAVINMLNFQPFYGNVMVGKGYAIYDIGLWAIRDEANANALTYAVGDLLYRSKAYSVFTKDPTGLGSPLGVVEQILPSGFLRIGIFAT